MSEKEVLEKLVQEAKRLPLPLEVHRVEGGVAIIAAGGVAPFLLGIIHGMQRDLKDEAELNELCRGAMATMH